MSLSAVPLAVVLTVLTLTLTTTPSTQQTTTPEPPATVCYPVEGVTVAEGETKSTREDQGKSYKSYTCNNASTGDITESEVECGSECVKEILQIQVNGVYNCVNCSILYLEREGCDSNTADYGCGSEPSDCDDVPVPNVQNCCLYCKQRANGTLPTSETSSSEEED